MKRLLAGAILVVTLGACSTDTSFSEENGVCYRNRDKNFLGLTYSSSEVQSVAANCEGR